MTFPCDQVFLRTHINKISRIRVSKHCKPAQNFVRVWRLKSARDAFEISEQRRVALALNLTLDHKTLPPNTQSNFPMVSSSSAQLMFPVMSLMVSNFYLCLSLTIAESHSQNCYLAG